MTDRLHSCKESPDGRHRSVYLLPFVCQFCGRRVPRWANWPERPDEPKPDAHLGAVGTE